MAQEFTLQIRLKADGSGLVGEIKGANVALKKLKGAEDKASGSARRLAANTGKMAPALKKSSSAMSNMARTAAVMQGPLGGVAGRISSIGALAKSSGVALAGLGIALSATIFIAKRSVEAFAGVEQQQLRIAALIKSTGFTAGFTAAQINDFAEQLDRTTLTSAEAARDAAGILLTFKSITGQQFKDTLRLSQDLAAVMGTDLRGAALQLGKALEEPEIGLTALRRSGVSFTESEKALIKSLNDTGQAAEAQRVILATLQAQIGGAGTAEAGGVSGSADTLAFAWTKLKEALGDGLLGDVVRSDLDALAGLLSDVRVLVAPTLQEQLVPLVEKQANAARHLAKARAQMGTSLLGPLEERQALAPLIAINAKIVALKRKISAREGAREDAARKAIAIADKRAAEQAQAKREAAALAAAAKAEAQAKADAAKAAKAAAAQAKAAAAAAAKATATLVRNNNRRAESLISLRGTLDPLFAAEHDYLQQLGQIDDALQHNLLTQNQANAMVRQADNAYRDLSRTLEDQANPSILVHVDAVKSLADTHQQTFQQMRDSIDGWSRDFANRMVDGSGNFRGFVDSVLKEMQRIALAKATDPFFKGFGSLLESAGQALFGANPFAGGAGPAAGSFRAAQTVGVGHTGGIAGAFAEQRRVAPEIFAGAQRYHLGGLAGDEVPAILRRGEEVLTRADPRHRANSGGGPQQVRVEIVNRGAPKEVQSATPRFDPVGMVVRIIQDDVRRGGPIANAIGGRQ